VDASGQLFRGRNGQPIAREVSVLPGQTASASLPASVVFGDGAALGALFRAIARLSVPPEPDTPNPCAGVQISVEIFDSITGRTNAVLVALPDPDVPPGQSGNPLGAAAPLVNLALQVRRGTRGGTELVAFYLAILRGEPIPVPGSARRFVPRLDHRMAAAA
jgi:hypothetical protein